MTQPFFSSLFLFLTLANGASAQNVTIDTSGDNTDKTYITYDKAISVDIEDTTDVKMARYCYLNSTVSGNGTINLYAGGERCWLGTKSAWANWTNFKGTAHIYPYKENSSKAGAFLIVLNHGGKVFSPEKVEDCVKDGMLNNALQGCKVTLHSGAGICNEANNQNTGGFRFGELQSEAGSTIQGYMKTGRASYYLVGCLNTDAVLAGTIAPSDYDEETLFGLIKEGAGTYRITGNQNFVSGALRVMEGRVLVNNDRAEAEKKKLRGGLGAKSKENEAIAYVFSKGVLGGTGSIGGAVDNYGVIEPGDDAIGTLTLQNYTKTSRNANLTVHPASVLRFKIASAEEYDSLVVVGNLNYINVTENDSICDEKPIIQISLDNQVNLKVGDTFTLLTAKNKVGNWQFYLQQPSKYTWAIEERTDDDGKYNLVLRLESLESSIIPENPVFTDCTLVTIGVEGVKTFCPMEELDFTSVSGMKAYIASVFNRQTGVLTLTRVNDVPIGTGLLLKGEPGTYPVPWKQSFSIVSNLLKGVTEATNVGAAEGGYVNYVLSNGSEGVGFYKVGAAGASLEAGRAYLQIPAEAATSRSSLRLRFDDEDEATGISATLTNSEEVNSAVYDLQGRRVEQPLPGLYIRNGKKVIIK